MAIPNVLGVEPCRAAPLCAENITFLNCDSGGNCALFSPTYGCTAGRDFQTPLAGSCRANSKLGSSRTPQSALASPRGPLPRHVWPSTAKPRFVCLWYGRCAGRPARSAIDASISNNRFVGSRPPKPELLITHTTQPFRVSLIGQLIRPRAVDYAVTRSAMNRAVVSVYLSSTSVHLIRSQLERYF
jgi:hypothetical protein